MWIVDTNLYNLPWCVVPKLYSEQKSFASLVRKRCYFYPYFPKADRTLSNSSKAPDKSILQLKSTCGRNVIFWIYNLVTTKIYLLSHLLNFTWCHLDEKSLRLLLSCEKNTGLVLLYLSKYGWWINPLDSSLCKHFARFVAISHQLLQILQLSWLQYFHLTLPSINKWNHNQRPSICLDLTPQFIGAFTTRFSPIFRYRFSDLACTSFSAKTYF